MFLMLPTPYQIALLGNCQFPTRCDLAPTDEVKGSILGHTRRQKCNRAKIG
jgi:hypothetical protein